MLYLEYAFYSAGSLRQSKEHRKVSNAILIRDQLLVLCWKTVNIQTYYMGCLQFARFSRRQTISRVQLIQLPTVPWCSTDRDQLKRYSSKHRL